jgi:predicted Zn finger-like uncharacterized protein
MLLTCEKCQSVYRIDPAKMAAGGRMVRCTTCGHAWFATRPPEEGAAAAAEAPRHEPIPENILPRHDEEAEAEPVVSKPPRLPQKTRQPVVDPMPGGMGANAFGLCVFLGLCFATLIPLLAFRGAVMQQAPSLALFYEKIGMPPDAPGEGLSFSGLVARTKPGEGQDATDMVLSARLSNVTAAQRPYPGLQIRLIGDENIVLKEWRFPPSDGQLQAGETVPFELSFQSIPDGGRTVDVRVLP